MSKAMLIHTLSKSNCEFSKRKISQLLDEAMKLIRKEVKKNKKFYYPTLLFKTYTQYAFKAISFPSGYRKSDCSDRVPMDGRLS